MATETIFTPIIITSEDVEVFVEALELSEECRKSFRKENYLELKTKEDIDKFILSFKNKKESIWNIQ